VTLDEFVDYYRNVSCTIDSDDYFALIMNNSWNLKGDATPYQKFEKGWVNEEAAKPEPIEWLKPQQSVQRTGQVSDENPLYRQQKYY
jgi:hypothetical protein